MESEAKKKSVGAAIGYAILTLVWAVVGPALWTFSVLAGVAGVIVTAGLFVMALSYVVSGKVRASLGPNLPGKTMLVLLLLGGLSTMQVASVQLERTGKGRAVSRAIAEAEKVALTGDLKGALRILDDVDSAWAPNQDDLRQLEREYHRKLGEKQEPEVRRALDAAQGLFIDGRYREALEALNRVKGLRYANSVYKADNLRERCEVKLGLRDEEKPVATVTTSDTASTTPSTGLTMAAYQQIRTGMSYAEVARILGSEGSEMSRADVLGNVSTIYNWKGSGFSNVTVTFHNDGVMSKAQIGLE